MKYINNQILEAVNRGINLALDDFDDNFDYNEPVSQLKIGKIINKSADIYIDGTVKKLLDVPIKNTINLEPEIKKHVRKFYKQLTSYCIKNNKKWAPNSREELKKFLLLIVPIDPKANLNWIDISQLTSLYALFDEFLSRTFNGDISEWNTSNITNMRNMFYRCEKFNCDISNWDVSNVRLMDGMFAECYKFNQDISNWDVSNVTDMSHMFAGCHNFNLDISKWNVLNVTDMSWMFTRCRKFDLDLSGWDVSNVTKNNGFSYKAEIGRYWEKLPKFINFDTPF